MDKYYLEFLKELHYCLDYYEHSSWSNWIMKSIELFEIKRDLTHYFSAFGGMGSLNDRNYEETVATDVIDVLLMITSKIAYYIKEGKSCSVEDILKAKQESYNNNQRLRYDTERENRQLDYINYLIDNYKFSNLHSINDEYIKGLTSSKKI